MRVLSVCTANQCRSVMIAAALRAAFADRGFPVEVTSAGTAVRGAAPATPEVRSALAKRGWPPGHDHRATAIRDVDGAMVDLAITAERQHLIDVAEYAKVPRHRTFTLHELHRLIAAAPPEPGEPLDPYLQRLSAQRGINAFLSSGPGPDDVADPTGSGRRSHRKALAQIEAVVSDIVTAMPLPWPPPIPEFGLSTTP